MDRLRVLRRRIGGMFRHEAADRGLDDEIRLHLELETGKNIELGMEPSNARRQARLSFGAVEAIKEEHREGRGIRWLDELASDLRFSVRALRRTPTLTAAAVLTLALGIGANAAIFSVVDAMILRPLPFPAPDRLTLIGEDNAEFGWHQADAAPANYLDWREQVSAFSDMAAYPSFGEHATLTGVGEPHLLNTATVTGNFFNVLGQRAALGRTLEDRETWRTGTPVAVISDRLWRALFQADSAVIGRTIVLDGRRVTIIGVAPAAFTFPFEGTDVWQPTAWDPGNRSQVWFRRAHFVKVIGRIRPGVSLATANRQLQGVVTRLQREFPATNRIMGAAVTPLQAFLVRDIRTPLLVLMSAVGVLLLIACANVANLLLIRGVGRQREAALRIALGAGRGRIARESMTYSLLLSAMGGVVGCIVAWGAMRALLAMRPAGVLPTPAIGVDGSMLAFLFAVTTVSAVVFGVGPAIWTGQRDPGDVMKQGGRSGSAAGSVRRAGKLMIVVELGLAAVLATGAGLLVRSFGRLMDVRPGFDPTGLLTVGLDLPGGRYDTDAKVVQFYTELERRTRALPGVVSVAAVSNPPLTSFSWSSQFAIEGRRELTDGGDVIHREITADYPTVMRVPLLQGRAFTSHDDRNAPLVVLINDVIARRYFAAEDPIGRRVSFDRVPDSASHWRTIVGVVGTEHQAGPDVEPRAEFLAPLSQEGGRSAMTLMVRTTVDPPTLAPAIRRTIAELDPDLAILSIRTMLQIRSESVAMRRFLMTLLLAFAGTGLLLGAVGVYGVMAHATAERRREMGIRAALGAMPQRLQGMVVRDGLRPAALGVGLGLGAAVLGVRLMASLLYGVSAIDPVTFVLVGALLLAVAAIATWIPAARAGRADPMESLRTE